ncbi:MAG: 16S rRNA (guanine(966)-N(2))-methyltransferase RsmD [Ruminococcaceae bacterium]|nr:16S rRNA (guanine(966)-N(2))-methyltransferase RsmD [Oscillospiraceae bacterium]
MRVISGTARGLKLESPKGENTRPTLDSVKEAIFSMLFDKVWEARILDLFSGSASLGIEALSRGASFCVFCDKSRDSEKVIRQNIEKARMSDKSFVLCSDFKDALKSLSQKGEKFDIVFLDPPYAGGYLDEALELLLSMSLLNEGATVVCESDFGVEFNMQNYNLIKDKKYGRVCISILEAQSE